MSKVERFQNHISGDRPPEMGTVTIVITLLFTLFKSILIPNNSSSHARQLSFVLEALINHMTHHKKSGVITSLC